MSCPRARVQVFDGSPSNREAVIGGSAATDFIERTRDLGVAVYCRMAAVSIIPRLNVPSGRAPVIAGANACEHTIDCYAHRRAGTGDPICARMTIRRPDEMWLPVMFGPVSIRIVCVVEFR